MFDYLPTQDETLDQLEQELLATHQVHGPLWARQIEALRRLDLGQVASADGCRTMTEWVASRLDVTHSVAAALMFLARADDPEVDRMLETGEIGLERAALLVRLRQSGASEEQAAASFGLDLSGLGRLLSDRERMSSEQERKSFADRFLMLQPSLDESWWRLAGGLLGPEGQAVEKALLERADQFPRLEGEGRAQRMADALTSLALDSLTGGSQDNPGRDITVADVIVDAHLAAQTSGEAGVRLAGGPQVGPNVLSEILCTGQVRVIVSDKEGNRVDYSDRGEAIPPAVRALIWKRDQGQCSVDGCRSRYRLQPHHIVERRHGGSHHPSNLALLCWYHHHVAIHGLGFRIDPQTPPGRRRLLRQHPGRGPPANRLDSARHSSSDTSHQ